MKTEKKQLIFALLLPLSVGGLSALLSGGMSDFKDLNQPPLSPPAWIFPVVWTILYLAMGFASYLVFNAKAPVYRKNGALLFYGLQLIFNFFWPIIFFKREMYLFAFIWLLALWVQVIVTGIKFWQINRLAGYLFIPYILWVTFAAYLNLGIYILN